jgi:hypothetical protein
MSILQYEGYLNQLKTSQEDYKTETLRIQRKFLYSICSHHRLWAKQTDNPEIANFHTKAADLAQESIDQYDHILEKYHLYNTGV